MTAAAGPMRQDVARRPGVGDIRFTTLDAICRVLDCQPGDILGWTAGPPA